ncbi:MAG: ATP-binding cassette domain-containing protein [Clostridiales bacterium]|jgi:ABC-type multidrug transport system ATPase subunit|nr:ATP-binding cassette domain-containing protein [Clostridiales bacterium]
MILEIRNLSKSYGDKKALENINCSLSEGIYGLLGPNGAGKSTLINILVNNLVQNTGEVLFDGKDIRSLGVDYRSLLGFMPQQQSLFDSFTARKFLGYMGTLKGMEKKKLNERIEEVLSMVNLSEASDKRLGSFSGGMKQRILIAQAILNDPKILILDEPTAGLDPKERIRIRNMISEISFSKLVLIATHVVTDIEFISNEIMILKQGELIVKSQPAKMLDTIIDKVYELSVREEELPQVSSNWRICSMLKDSGSVIVRILSDEKPKGYDCRPVKPVLEDLYLYLFDDRIQPSPEVMYKLREALGRGCLV